MLPYAALIAVLGLSVSHGFVLQPWAGNSGCNDPKYWCKSIETANECEVSYTHCLALEISSSGQGLAKEIFYRQQNFGTRNS